MELRIHTTTAYGVEVVECDTTSSQRHVLSMTYSPASYHIQNNNDTFILLEAVIDHDADISPPCLDILSPRPSSEVFSMQAQTTCGAQVAVAYLYSLQCQGANPFPDFDSDHSGSESGGDSTDLDFDESVPLPVHFYQSLLKPGPYPEGVHVSRREMYLDEDDFQLLMGCNKEEWMCVPKWKRDFIKKRLGLF